MGIGHKETRNHVLAIPPHRLLDFVAIPPRVSHLNNRLHFNIFHTANAFQRLLDQLALGFHLKPIIHVLPGTATTIPFRVLRFAFRVVMVRARRQLPDGRRINHADDAGARKVFSGFGNLDFEGIARGTVGNKHNGSIHMAKTVTAQCQPLYV